MNTVLMWLCVALLTLEAVFMFGWGWASGKRDGEV